MKFYSNISSLFIITSLICTSGYPLVALDIGKQGGYHSGSHNITVQKHVKDGQTFYKHVAPKESRISGLTLNGEYIHSEFIPPHDDYLLSSLVHWKNGRPEVVTIDCMRITVFLWNNGNGRLVHQASTIREGYGIQTASVLDRQVTINLDQRIDSRTGMLYMATDKSIMFSMLTDRELPGYYIYRHTGSPFMIEKVLKGTAETGIKVVPEVHNVYVYKWNDVPILVDFEIFNGKVLSFAYLDSTWKAIRSPKNDDYKRKHFLRELLAYINCAMGNGAIVDIHKRDSRKPLVYPGGRFKFLDLKEVSTAPVTVELVPRNTRDFNGYQEFKHVVKGKSAFDVKHIVYDKIRVMIDLPSGPVRSVSLFVKDRSPSYVEVVVGGECTYYRDIGNHTFVKCAVSDRQIRYPDIFLYTPGKVYTWKNGWIRNK